MDINIIIKENLYFIINSILTDFFYKYVKELDLQTIINEQIDEAFSLIRFNNESNADNLEHLEDINGDNIEDILFTGHDHWFIDFDSLKELINSST